MSARRDAPVISGDVDPDDLEDDGPVFAWLPPDDRLWRHPSELQTSPPRGPGRGSGLREIEHRIWAVALLAGTVGALLASGVGVATGGGGSGAGAGRGLGGVGCVMVVPKAGGAGAKAVGLIFGLVSTRSASPGF